MIYRFTPKLDHVVIWAWPDNEDSAIALERALQGSRIKRVVLLVSDPTEIPIWQTGPKTIWLRKNSLPGWIWFCFARYVFFTHPCFTRNFPPQVVSVNLWHGMPIKKIGKLIENDPVIHSRHTLATSPFWAEIMRRTIAPADGDVLCTGLPRNDRLFSDTGEVFKKLGLSTGVRLLAWLPTYRKSIRGLPRTDGIEAGNGFEMPDVEPETLNTFLKSRNAVLLVKPHPMASFDQSKTWSNLLIVDDTWLRKRSLSLYEFLGATDLLISDISSVTIDYLLLDRPIIHAFADCGEYAKSRGFTVEPISSYLMGPVVTDSQGLYDALESVFSGNDPGTLQRRNLMDLSHTHRDNGASRRLLVKIGILD